MANGNDEHRPRTKKKPFEFNFFLPPIRRQRTNTRIMRNRFHLCSSVQFPLFSKRSPPIRILAQPNSLASHILCSVSASPTTAAMILSWAHRHRIYTQYIRTNRWTISNELVFEAKLLWFLENTTKIESVKTNEIALELWDEPKARERDANVNRPHCNWHTILRLFCTLLVLLCCCPNENKMISFYCFDRKPKL